MPIHALVVDNNPVHLKAVSTFMENEGCEVSVAENGLEALELLKKNMPDILITDLVMPMVDGEQLCKIIRGAEEYKDIFVIVLSAIILEDKQRILSEVDCDMFIAKGTLTEIRENLQQALKKYSKKDFTGKEVLSSQSLSNKSAQSSVTKELLLEKGHLLRIFENLAEGIIEVSYNGRIISINSAAEDIWNQNREEIIGRKFKELPWGNHAGIIEEWCREELESHGIGTLEILENDPLRIDGKVLTLSLVPVVHNDSYCSICILRDITRQYLAEKEKEEIDNAIKLVKKMEAMSGMAGGVAHDFNNLLTVICGNLDMISIKKGCEHEQKNLKSLQSARQSAYSAVELVRKISISSPFGIIQRQDIELEGFTRKVVETFFDSNKLIRYRFKIIKKGYSVHIDSVQIETALVNILQNAIESGSTKDIVIEIDREVVDVPGIKSGQYLSPGEYGKITVRDLGRGICKDNIHEIFDPYFSTKERGTLKGMGLGLTIVYSTLRNHGGYVVVESEEDAGTSVSMYLPVYGNIGEQSDHGKNTHILLVEGDPELRSICKIMLEYLNYSVTDVESKTEALQCIKTAEKGEKKVTAAIISLSEDGVRGGVGMCSELHTLQPDLKVIITSGSIFDPVMRDYSKYGFAACLAKPYTMDDLKKAISILK